MTNTIINHLQELEQTKNTTILMAIESGSRAWGFPSPDSDYDVRMVYLHQSDWYLSITNQKDTIAYFHGELLDINGWDIRKTLSLLRKSNATPFEWSQSPICYLEKEGFRAQLLNLAKQFFQPYHTINHYKGIAKNSFSKMDANGQIKLKKLFYVIRPLLAINWVIQDASVPPMDIFNLMDRLEDAAVKEEILELIALKAGKKEEYVYDISLGIKNYLLDQFEKVSQLNWNTEQSVPNIEVLNNYFRNLISKNL